MLMSLSDSIVTIPNDMYLVTLTTISVKRL